MSVIKVKVLTTADNFWDAVNIYLDRPNSINKQVLFSEKMFIAESRTCLSVKDCRELVSRICFNFPRDCRADFFNCVPSSNFTFAQIENLDNVLSLPDVMYLFVRKLIPKVYMQSSLEFFEFIFLDRFSMKVYIFTESYPKISDASFNSVEMKSLDPFVTLKFNFMQLYFNKECLEITYDKSLSEKGVNWLNATFAPKFTKLMCNNNAYQKRLKNANNWVFNSRVDIVQYYKKYDEMKLKYAKYFVENWTENTDPKKFVYEDIAIASYLIMLWNGGTAPESNLKKQKFVDLGCGNGLLVHILNSEGHSGIGIDIRRRKIWSTYPPTTVLIESTIIPTITTTYPEADWLIGNHSDELTAWIPIMARLSNHFCQYFVLPCCPYQLNGMKFQRKNSSFSSYQNFIAYVKQISEHCEFETFIDKLKIPSTKRICLIGTVKHDILEEQYSALKTGIINLIKEEYFDNEKYNRKNATGHQESENTKISLNIKVRESVEPVRNCTKLPHELINSALIEIMNELLKEHSVFKVIKNGLFYSWNRGRKLPIGELASCLNADLLKQLKKECKGLQTLLKNHHFIFEVGQGCVQFRSPESLLQLCNKFLENHNSKWKAKKCWFFNNHPDKCPLDDNVCSYSHDY